MAEPMREHCLWLTHPPEASPRFPCPSCRPGYQRQQQPRTLEAPAAAHAPSQPSLLKH